MREPAPRTSARSITFSSSRTLPGQVCQRSTRHHVVGYRAVTPADLVAVLAQQVLHERRQVVGSFAQRRHPHLDDVDPVQQILPKPPFRHQSREIAMRRCDDAHIDRDGGGSANGMHFLFLQDAQELALQGWRHVANLIEEHRPALSQLEQAPLVVVGIRERTTTMAEELAFEECLWNGGTIHREKWTTRARTLLVHRSSQQLFSRPAFAHEQDRRVALCRAIDEPHHREHRGRLGQNAGQLIANDLDI